MIESIPRDAFGQLAAQLEEKVGTYRNESKEYLNAYEEDGFTSVHYQAQFSKDSVLVTVVLDIGEKIRVSGLWFDSPNLRK